MSSQSAEKVPILLYHSVSTNSSALFEPFIVTPDHFAEQMKYLYENKYTPITVTQLVRARARNTIILPQRPVVITFDDGFSDFYTEALPILNRYDFTATIYISTSFIEGTSRWLEAVGEGMRSMLTWQQVSEIHARGIECGAHTHTHPPLDMLPVIAARAEIATSKKILEDHLEQEVLSFAYPFGYYTNRVRQTVWDLGFHSAAAVKYKLSPQDDDIYTLARQVVSKEMGIEQFAALLTESPPTFRSMMNTLYKQTHTVPPYLVRRCTAMARRHFTHPLVDSFAQV